MKFHIGIAALLILALAAPYALATTWSEPERFAGAWAGGGFDHKFQCASKIELELWLSADGHLEGAALFSKDDKYCLGKVQVAADNARLVFTGMDGPLCDCSDKGVFQIHRFIEKQNRLALSFERHNSPNIFSE